MPYYIITCIIYFPIIFPLIKWIDYYSWKEAFNFYIKRTKEIWFEGQINFIKV